MELPIKIIITASGYSSWNTAFLPSRLDAIGYENNRFEAIVTALVQAGVLEILDIESIRRQQQEMKNRVPEPMAVPDNIGPL